MENQVGPTNGLEDRLRGLILANSEDGHQELHPSGVARGNVQLSQVSFDYPRHSTYWGKADESPNPFKATQATQATHATQATRKRPNQAERRQMAAELSIPVNTRPEPVITARQHASYPRQHNQTLVSADRGVSHRDNRNFGPGNRGNRRDYGHQSGDTQHSHQSHTTQNHPVPHQHHHQYHAHGGAQPPGNAENWRQGPQQQNQWQGRPQGPRLYQPGEEEVKAQAAMLEKLCIEILANAEISIEELTEKENFRLKLEQVCREVVIEHEFSVDGVLIAPHTVELKCFGSLASGFATKAADMDLALLSPQSTIQPDAPGSPIPRLLEKAFLQMGIGARLLTRTRVPIIKICERPPEHFRADLLAYRLKWEAGESVEVGGPDGEQPDGPASTAAPEEPQGGSATTTPATDEETGFAMRLASLKQSGMSFSSYCGSVKAFIRKIGCFDLSQANAQTFPPDIRQKLGDVCHAFVSGLADPELKKRLFSYYSLSAMHGQFRTLQGVLIQVEGEMLAMRWTRRSLPEKDERQEEYAQQAIADWVRIQNEEDFHVDAIAYQRQLYHAAERLKRIPSLQVMDFQQAEFESAAAYHLRAIQLMIELGGADSQDPPDTKVLPVIITRYVAGIYNPDIQSGVDAFVATKGARSLRAIARRHKSLQLAHEFQKALVNGYYQEPEAGMVRRYMACLQYPMKQRKQKTCHHFDYIVPMRLSIKKEVWPVIKRLGNPALLALNQPRDRYHDPLEFPKTGAGVQCDVNFSAHLALHNTALLRCYSYTDPRVKPLVLFVKHWAKVRGINTPYRGSLSSYGYVLMVLHYLVNVVRPFVCPNLQLLALPDDPNMPPEHYVCEGYNVRFWHDEATIKQLASQNRLNQNNQSLGHLLRGFFEYYAYPGNMSSYQGVRGFDWSHDVISLRTLQGILKKDKKGWTGAKTVTEVNTVAAPPGSGSSKTNQNLVHGLPATQEVREVRHRYLFAIEDPFETDHNVARTVTHTGIVAIRDEFRRAWRLIRSAGGEVEPEDLLEDATRAEQEKNRQDFKQLMLEIHGKYVFDDNHVFADEKDTIGYEHDD
jgi:terminal uridylyltransferase